VPGVVPAKHTVLFRSPLRSDIISQTGTLMRSFHCASGCAAGSPVCRLLRLRYKRPRDRCATDRDNEFSPPDVDCHVTLLWGHATKGTISHLAVLRCGIGRALAPLGVRPGSARGGTVFGGGILEQQVRGGLGGFSSRK
jgi:hypothetical protein